MRRDFTDFNSSMVRLKDVESMLIKVRTVPVEISVSYISYSSPTHTANDFRL